MKNPENNIVPLVFLTLLFFTWGFLTCMNDILIPHLQNVFQLSHFQSMLIQFCFFGAYFTISAIYFFSSLSRGDLISKIGYKKGIIFGLLIMALGCALFYPAAEFKMYGFFLSALFIMGAGMTLLQIAANPYVALLGKPENAAGRLNLTQAVNSFGTTIAPAIGAYFIFSSSGSILDIEVKSVQLPYLVFSLILVLVAVVFLFADLPVITRGNNIIKGIGAIKYPHLVLGAIGIFMYVGGEVTIGSTLIRFLNLENIAGLTESEASQFLSFYWGGLMIGRFFGAIALSKLKNILLRNLAFAGVIISSFTITYSLMDLTTSLTWLVLVLLNLLAFILGKYQPAKILGLFAGIIMLILVLALVTNGIIAMWAIISIGLFNSIMWSNIFTLAIKDLGEYTSQASSVLIMGILGAALIPPIQGLVADSMGLHLSYIVPFFCYAYILFYGLKGYKVKYYRLNK